MSYLEDLKSPLDYNTAVSLSLDAARNSAVLGKRSSMEKNVERIGEIISYAEKNGIELPYPSDVIRDIRSVYRGNFGSQEVHAARKTGKIERREERFGRSFRR